VTQQKKIKHYNERVDEGAKSKQSRKLGLTEKSLRREKKRSKNKKKSEVSQSITRCRVLGHANYEPEWVRSEWKGTAVKSGVI